MPMSDAARRTRQQLFGDRVTTLPQTDPELASYFDTFLFDEAWNHGSLDPQTRLLVVLGGLVGCGARTQFRTMLGAALDNGVTPVQAKEVVYHAIAYMGIGRVYDFLTITNDVLEARGVELPLEGQSTTTPETRMDKGKHVQGEIIGHDRVEALHATATADQKHIQEWLSANCFGDNYTRGGISLATRELLTFVVIVAQGGCDSQARSHVAGNLRVGNGRQVLLDAVSQLLPYLGYPRSLNAIAAINEVAPAEQA